MSAETWNGLLNGLNAYAEAEQSALMVRGVRWLRARLGLEVEVEPESERPTPNATHFAGALEPPITR